MKIGSGTNTLVTKGLVSSPIRVCMHLLQTARTDFRVMRDATALIEAGFEVFIVDVDRDLSRPAEEIIDGVHLRHMRFPGWYRPSHFKPWFFVKMMQAIIMGTVQLLRTDADIYHAHIEKAFPACYFTARLRHKPLILDAPELTLSDRTLVHWKRLNALVTAIFASIVPHCNGVITASPLYAQEISKRYHISDVTVIRNVPLHQTAINSNRLRQHLNLRPEVRIALYQGMLQPNRGLDVLVHAASFLDPNIVIIMMGNGLKDTVEQLTALIKHEGVADRVKIIPAAPYAELLNWTASADIGLTVLPPDYSLSIRMCLPNKLFEYLMAGLPVLSSPLDAVAEVLTSYQVGQVVSSLTPKDVAVAINTMLADDSALAHMRQNALEVARDEFHWENERQKLVGLYHKILGKQTEQ